MEVTRKFKYYSLVVFLTLGLNSFGQNRDNGLDRHLLSMVKEKKLKQRVINYKITDQHISKKSRVKHIYYRQVYNNYEIIGTESGFHTLANGELLSSSNKFVLNLDEKVVTSNSFVNTYESIIAHIARQMNYIFKSPLKNIDESFNENHTKVYSDGGISKRNIPVKKVYYAKEFGKVVPAWELSIYEISGKNWWNFIIDDKTGEIIRKNNWIVNCNHIKHSSSHKEVKTNKEKLKARDYDALEGNSSYNVFALPLENPLFGPRTLEVDPHDILASPFGWHDTNGLVGAEYTVTRGNNVDAYNDGSNPGYQPDGGVDLIFDFPFNPVYSSSDNSGDAAITNLFYWNNVIHDILFQYGFDEESGNFQENNYTGLGFDNDQVNAEAQDGSGTCNANFGTPPDGSSGTMQMYVCENRDGDFDNHVIIHEYGHGISNRLTGGGSNTDCLFNDEQMGEGWSDWYGSVLTMTSSDLGTDLQPVGNWLFGQDQDGLGIRDYPYTTDLSQDPRTYDYIKTTFGPHPLGSTWAAMLWELTWELIDDHGFDEDVYNGTGGNNIAIALVTEALKLQPCSPGFIDGRDAILAADVALYGGQNQCSIWDAFAKRGLGLSAEQGSTGSRTDGTEAFDSLSTILTTPEEIFCLSQSILTLGGGVPVGGVYSGPGVTDNGNGQTYSFNPISAGVGVHTIVYSAESPCSGDGVGTNTITVRSEEPIIECANLTISLDENNQATIIPQDVVTNFLSGDYILNQTGSFNPIDISVSGTSVILGDDQFSENLPIGFDFNFYQNEYSTFHISSNGFISFSDNQGSGCCSGQNIPSGNTPNNLIALGWTDLDPGFSENIKYSTIGVIPNRVLIVDFNIPTFSGGGVVNSQIKLFEGSNNIEIHSTDVQGNSMTQGIENIDGTVALAVPDRNAQTISILNDFVAFNPNTGLFPTNCGYETTVTLDIDTFDCTNLGENSVIATATDTNGNTASCTSIVTVLASSGPAFNLENIVYCEDESIQTGLTGGTPIGGVYSGLGVVDDGNGTTFSFNPSMAGEGLHILTYTNETSCGTNGDITIEIEVLSGIPDIVCQDITVALNLNGTLTIEAEQLLSGNTTSLYALNPFVSNANIARYDYDLESDTLILDENYSLSTGIERGYSIDKNPNNGQAYLLAGVSQGASRQLFQLDLENGNLILLNDEIVSVNGNVQPQDMSFDANGVLYFTFSNGEINSYNIATQTLNALATVTNNGATGLTYDYDNNKLIHATGSFPITLTAIDAASGAVSPLFSINTSCGGQAIEYIGDNKLIVSSTSGCNTIYTIDLTTETSEVLLNPSGSFTSIKDLMFVNNLPIDNCNGEPLSLSLSQNTFGCSDIGAQTVIITATDNQGNTTTCSSMVTVEGPSSDEVTFNLEETVFCVDESIQAGLTGGTPEGGVYSGSGVTDDGNGLTFSFNSAVAGVGMHTLTYSLDSCGTQITAVADVEVLSGIPDIVCQDITVALNLNGTLTIEAEQLLSGNTTSLYALNPFVSNANIARYDYDLESDTLILDENYSLSTGIERGFAIDKNKNDGYVYLLAGTSSNSPRQLFRLDIENGALVLLDDGIVSVNGSTQPQDMSFGVNGELFFTFSSGEINSYNIATQTLNALATVTNNGATGLTYDYDNNKLIHATGSFPITLTAIDAASGAVSPLFSINTSCGGQAIEYIGDNKLIVSSTSGCNTIYTIDLTTETSEVLLNPSGSFTSIKDLMFVNNLPIDNCNGEPLSLSLSQNTFGCSDIGAQTVIITATDNQGNTTTCSSMVTVEGPSSDEVTFNLEETVFCVDESIQAGLTGGTPEGGVYSGSGVTDDGNGLTFSFNSAVAGVGMHTLTYSLDSCGTQITAVADVEVLSGIPDIVCQDITVALNLNGTLTIEAEQLLSGNTTSLYALNPFVSNANIARYDYDLESDTLILDENYSLSTGIERGFAIDKNKNDGYVYLLAGTSSNSPRQLFRLDIENGALVLLDDGIVSVNGSTQPQDMSFGVNGELFFTFSSGEINSYNIATQTLNALATVTTNGATGLTYDYDNNKLIHATGSFPITLTAIDAASGAVSPLFSINTSCGGQAIEYIGDNKLIVSSTSGCNTIYTIDLTTETSEVLLNPSGSFTSIKDLMFVNNLPIDNCNGEPLSLSLSQNTFGCSDIGAQTVIITATDNQGNTTTCSSMVTVEGPSSDEVTFNLEETVFCVDESIQAGLTGGTPEGGVYSGSGVTDDGNGLTFSFNSAVAGVGMHTLTYSLDSCGTQITAVADVEVLPAIPDLVCQDLIIELDANDQAVIIPEDIVTNFLPGDGYTHSQTGAFNPEDISDNGISIALGDDQISASLPIGFSFTFYENQYSSFYISSNGFITFSGNQSSGCCSGQNIPNGNTPNNLISVGWTDLHPSFTGIKYTTIGLAPTRQLIVDFNIPTYSGGGVVNSQIKLFEGSNNIEIHSADVQGNNMTQGIENSDGTDALPVPDRNSQTVSIVNDYVAFMPNTGAYPSNCDYETTVVLDIDTFDCSHLGENTVTTTVTDSNGNSLSCSSIVTIVDTDESCTLSVNSFEFSNEILIYPNPVKESFVVSWSNINLKEIQLFDVNGRLILKQSLLNLSDEKEINVSKLSSGVYFVKLTSENNGVLIKRIIKDK